MYNKKFLLIILTLIIIVNAGIVFAEDTNDLNQTIDDSGILSIDDESVNLQEVDSSSDDEKLSDSNEDILKDTVISDDIPLVERGVVSGGVDLTATHPWGPSDSVNGNRGEITYLIPSEATDIKFAYVYVNIYAGTAQPTYDIIANTTITTANAISTHSEYLWYPSGVTDGTRFVLNDYIDKVYSDYMIFYNITDMVQGLNGTSVSVDVLSLPGNRQFDGRIKLVSLILAYDDGDDDEVFYQFNAGQAWTDAKTGVSFDAGEFEIGENGKGSYYQYHEWDLTELFDSELYLECTASSSGWASFKEAMSLLVVDNSYYSRDSVGGEELSFRTEYSLGTNPIVLVYAGTNNTITASVKVNYAGTYNLKLLVDGVEVDSVNVNLQKLVATTVHLTDPTIRAVDKNTDYKANHDKTNYTLLLYYDGEMVNSFSSLIPVLYNGLLSKDFAYESGYDIPFSYNTTITGDIVVNVKDENTYLNRKDLNRTDVWNLELPSGSNLVRAFIYVPYNYYIPNYLNNITENENLIEATFNGNKLNVCGYYRDQSNILHAFTTEYPYAVYGYGVFIYDVTEYLRNGDNTLFLKKFDEYPALNPSTLIYMYNKTSSDTLKFIYIDNTADILENSYNVANRPVELNTRFNVSSELVQSADFYVFAATDDSGDGAYIVFNGERTKWTIEGKQTSLKKLDIKRTVKDINNVTVGAYSNVPGYRLFALQQIMVLTKKIQTSVSSINTEYGNVAFAGTSNKVYVEIKNTRSGEFTINLYADGAFIGSQDIVLNGKSTTISFADPTIRPIDVNTVYGGDNDKVNYTAEIIFNGEKIGSYSISAPILYDGYLGKDFSYPSNAFNPFFNGTITGDIVIDVKDYTSYLDNYGASRADVWEVTLPANSNFVKSLIYVPYNYFNPHEGLNENLSMFSTRFNDVEIVPVLLYRDQINFGSEADYGYGVLVYDVSQLIKVGSNSFALTKKSNVPFVYPSTLIYMYNTTGSKTIKDVYISNDADLLSFIDFNELNREVKVNSVFNINSSGKVDAKLYVFAAGAQKGEGNIIFNNDLYEDVWNGNTNSTNLYELDVTNLIKDTNVISFISTKSYLLALQQIIVITKELSGDSDNSTTPDPGNPTNPDTDKQGTAKVTKKATKITAKKKTFKAKIKVKKYTITLKAGKSSVKKVKVTIKIGKKIYAANTNAKGKATFKIKKLTKKGKYNAVIKFKGNSAYKASSRKVKITIK